MTGDLYDAPNQQAVRPDGSAPWEEGDGGAAAEPEPEKDLGSMTKAQLLEEADARGVDADDSMTKAQILEALEA